MRLRRLCQKKKSGRKSVDVGIIEDHLEGGEKREILEMSLLRSLAKYGTDRTMYKKVRVARFMRLAHSTQVRHSPTVIYLAVGLRTLPRGTSSLASRW